VLELMSEATLMLGPVGACSATVGFAVTGQPRWLAVAVSVVLTALGIQALAALRRADQVVTDTLSTTQAPPPDGPLDPWAFERAFAHLDRDRTAQRLAARARVRDRQRMPARQRRVWQEMAADLERVRSYECSCASTPGPVLSMDRACPVHGGPTGDRHAW
jgi:cytochrome c biogenesis protein CcdA